MEAQEFFLTTLHLTLQTYTQLVKKHHIDIKWKNNNKLKSYKLRSEPNGYPDTIVAGWPEDIRDIPKALCPYHNHHDIMTVEDGLILKGETLIIPPLEREKYYKLYMKDTWESSSASTMQDNAYIGLESMKTSGKWLKHAQHAKAIAHRNQDSHYNQSVCIQSWTQYRNIQFIHRIMLSSNPCYSM